MIAYNCPLNRAVCDGCNYHNTGGCVLANHSHAFTISHEDSVKLWERRKEALMKLSKDDLVELIIGRKPV